MKFAELKSPELVSEVSRVWETKGVSRYIRQFWTKVTSIF